MNSTETNTELPPRYRSRGLYTIAMAQSPQHVAIIITALNEIDTLRTRLKAVEKERDDLVIRIAKLLLEAGNQDMQLTAVEKANGELLRRLELIRQSVSIGSDGRLELEDEEKFAKALATAEALKGESVMQKFHDLTPQGQLQEQIKTLKSQNERLVKALDWAMRNLHITFVKGGPQEDVKEFKEAKALLAEVNPKMQGTIGEMCG